MSEFLVIVPTDGWTEMPGGDFAMFLANHMDAPTILNYANDLWNLSTAMVEAGILPDNSLISEYQMIPSGGDPAYRFWYKLTDG